MKKFIIIIEVILLILILAKVTSVFGLLKKADTASETSLITSQAMAQQSPEAKPVTVVPVAGPASGVQSVPAVKEKDTLDESLTKQRDLAAVLQAKKIELDNRENTLRAEEQRLLTLRKEITDKIALLKGQEEKLTAIFDAGQSSDIKKYKEMAKVYEATPPAKAGSMLEKLDIKTAAGITMNMKKDKAGAVWGFISAQKAVEITKEITRSGKQFPE
jgi:flagellar motility protein MotE (MotC chaperone)